jgi:hypothetical protein
VEKNGSQAAPPWEHLLGSCGQACVIFNILIFLKLKKKCLAVLWIELKASHLNSLEN